MSRQSDLVQLVCKNRIFFGPLSSSFSLPQLFVFLFDVLSVAVFVIRDRFVKKQQLVLKPLSLCNKVVSF